MYISAYSVSTMPLCAFFSSFYVNFIEFTTCCKCHNQMEINICELSRSAKCAKIV